jgi:hypothetical protein
MARQGRRLLPAQHACHRKGADLLVYRAGSGPAPTVHRPSHRCGGTQSRDRRVLRRALQRGRCKRDHMGHSTCSSGWQIALGQPRRTDRCDQAMVMA